MNTPAELQVAGEALDLPMENVQVVAQASICSEFRRRADSIHAELAALQRDMLSSAHMAATFRVVA